MEQLSEAVHQLVLYTKGSEQHRIRVVRGGGIQAVLSTMRAHPTNAALMEHCCGALCNITVYAEARIAVAKQGGIELLVAAMRAHPTVERLQKRCCGALAHIGRADPNKPLIVAAGGLEAVLAAMQLHAAPVGSTEMQARACAALHTLASGPLSIRRRVAEAGAIGAIITALSAHRVSHSAVDHGCGALCLLVAEPTMRRLLLSPQLVNTVARSAVLMPQSRYLRACFDSIARLEHPEVLKAREEGHCSAARVPRCASGNCPATKHCYCTECCVPQRAFACGQCDDVSGPNAGRMRFCQVCRERCHAGHTGIIELFTPLSCDCTNTSCKLLADGTSPVPAATAAAAAAAAAATATTMYKRGREEHEDRQAPTAADTLEQEQKRPKLSSTPQDKCSLQ